MLEGKLQHVFLSYSKPAIILFSQVAMVWLGSYDLVGQLLFSWVAMIGVYFDQSLYIYYACCCYNSYTLNFFNRPPAQKDNYASLDTSLGTSLDTSQNSVYYYYYRPRSFYVTESIQGTTCPTGRIRFPVGSTQTFSKRYDVEIFSLGFSRVL